MPSTETPQQMHNLYIEARQLLHMHIARFTQAMVLSVATLLAFTSACRQKKHHIMRHMKFAAIYQNFTNVISHTIAKNLMTIYYTTSHSVL